MLARRQYSGNLRKDILFVNEMTEIDYAYIDYDLQVYAPPNAAILDKFIENSNRLVFVCDADADGFMSSAVARTKYSNAIFVYGDRDGERGLSADLFHQIYAFYHPDSIVTLDCGISNFEGIEEAKKHNVRVFVTDHHVPKGELPDCSIINPWLDKNLYDFVELCGAGVIYSSIAAVHGENSDALQYAAIGTVCDVVPMICDNRYITKRGLHFIAHKPTNPIKRLISASGAPRNLTAKDIGWKIGPMVNSASRIGRPELVFDAMFSNKNDSVKELISANNLRKTLTDDGIKQAKLQKRNGIVFAELGGDYVGVCGLIALKIAAEYDLPACAYVVQGKNVKASVRSLDHWSVAEMFVEIGLQDGGGHYGAGGFICKKEEIGNILEKIADFSSSRLNMGKKNEYDADIEISVQELIRNSNYYFDLAPYGNKFRAPTFCSVAVLDESKSKITANGHLVFDVDGVVAYFYNPQKTVPYGKKCAIVYELEYNAWKKAPQIVISKIEEEDTV